MYSNIVTKSYQAAELSHVSSVIFLILLTVKTKNQTLKIAIKSQKGGIKKEISYSSQYEQKT